MKHFKNIWIWTYNQKILFYIFLIIFLIPNVFLVFTEPVSTLTKVCNIIVPLSLYWFLLSLTAKPGKMLWLLFIFIFFGAFQLVLIYLFGESVIAVDMFLNLLTTNSGEASELLRNLMPAVVAVIILYVSTLALATVSLNNKKTLDRSFRKTQRYLSLGLLSLGLLLVSINYFADPYFRVKNDIFPINVCYNVGLAVERDAKSRNYFETSKDFKFNSKSSHDTDEKELYIFVIGETARAANFGIYGYDRNTTPKLQEKVSDLLIFKDALSQSNTTHKSVPMLMSEASAEDYSLLYVRKGIIEAFNEAGYETSFFSNQRPNHSFIDYLGEESDNDIFVKDNLPDSVNVLDGALLSLLKKEIEKQSAKKKFIVLHTYGSHFNYQERYPKSFAQFMPDSIKSVSLKYKQNIINAYDNSILYTDYFLNSIIEMAKKTNVSASVIYTSDHAEDLYDDSRNLFLHASPVPTFYQLYVPYIIWMSPEYIANHPEKYKYLKGNVSKPIATNLVTYHTILSIAGITGTGINSKYSLADSAFTVTQRYYLNDHNLPLPLDKIGLKDLDDVAFKKYRVRNF